MAFIATVANMAVIAGLGGGFRSGQDGGNDVLKHFLVAIVPIVAFLFAPLRMQAKSVNDYDSMSPHDQGRYILTLVEGSKDLLAKQGRQDIVLKITQVFETHDPGETISKGAKQFARDLDAAEQYQQKTGKTLQVESALLLTFQKLGIEVPKDAFMHLGDKFKPVDPLKKK